MNTETKKNKPLILIVDDTARNIQVVGNILKDNIVCNFSFARNGRQALETVKKAKPDIILLDIMMPEMDGYEVCRELKKNSETQDIPVIFLTAKTETEGIVKGFESGAVDYVTKPFNSAELLARVKTQLKIKEQNDLIKRQNNERKELLHILCHDLSNPFSSIISVMDILRECPDIRSKIEMEDSLVKIAENGLELIRMVREMRALEEKKSRLKLDSLNLKLAFDKSYMILRQKFDSKNIIFDYNIDENINILAEEISFVNSVLNNILTNAVKFSSQGSAIRANAQRNADGVEISIRDSGIGIPPDILHDIFDLSKTTSREGTEGESGTGFGMPMVRKFMDIYGGSMEVNSRDVEDFPEDHGTEVILKLKLPES